MVGVPSTSCNLVVLSTAAAAQYFYRILREHSMSKSFEEYEDAKENEKKTVPKSVIP